jgi:hypothetical protein
MNLLSIKAVKIYKLIALILILSTLFVFMFIGYINLIQVRRSIGEAEADIDDIDKVIQEWTLQYAEDIQDLNQIDKDLYEAQIRLRILYQKYGLEY